MRVGVVGAGVMGSNHARVLAGLPGVTLVGVVDPSPTHLTRTTELANCQGFETLDQLLAAGVSPWRTALRNAISSARSGSSWPTGRCRIE